MITSRTTHSFTDRREAGQVLAEHLTEYADRPNLMVLALPRGGVPVAYEVAHRFQAPLDVFLVRKLGMPGHEELALGAVASGGVCVLNDELIHTLNISPDIISAVKDQQTRELRRREQAYRGKRLPPEVAGRTIIVIDDGLATGATMRAAVVALRSQRPAEIIAAAPVGSRDTCEELATVADHAVCAIVAERFYAVGFWYQDFTQTTDDEVANLLGRARRELHASPPNTADETQPEAHR